PPSTHHLRLFPYTTLFRSHRQLKNPALDHLQHVLDRKAGVDPLDLDRWQLAQGQLLVDLMDHLPGGAAGGQRQGTPGKLLDLDEDRKSTRLNSSHVAISYA